MPVTILDAAPASVFAGVAQIYQGSRQVALLNAAGGTLVAGPAPDVAPAITQPPAILPEGAGLGDSVTLALGAAEGAPQPAPEWDLTLNGVSIRDRLDEGAMALELAEPGYYELTVSWDNRAGTATAERVGFAVEEPVAPALPAIDYDTQALAYLDAQTPFTGQPDDVLSVAMRGTGGYVLSKVGSGAAIGHSAQGLVFADGAFLQSDGLRDQPTTDGIFVVAEATLTGYGSNMGHLIYGAGGHVKLRDKSGTMELTGQDQSTVVINMGDTPYGSRMVIAGQLDDVLDSLTGIDPQGQDLSAPHPGIADPSFSRAVVGRFMVGTLHRLAIVGRAEGEDWPVTMHQVYADFMARG